jgi:hypothetical protein
LGGLSFRFVDHDVTASLAVGARLRGLERS